MWWLASENTHIWLHHFKRDSVLCRKNGLKIPKGQSESVNRRTDNTMAKRNKDRRTNNDLQNIPYKIKHRVIRTPLKTFPPSLTKLLPDLTIWGTGWMSYKKQELLTLHQHLVSHPLPRVFVSAIIVLLNYFIFLCCVFALFVFVLYLVPGVVCVSGLYRLECSFGFL